jgi:multicomponent Na+:H+ antiporter subunit D
MVPIVGLAVVTLALGLYADPLAALAERAAAELLDPSAYTAAVLSPEGLPTAARP